LTERLPGFTRRTRWFMENNPEFREHVAIKALPEGGNRLLLSIVTSEQLPRVLRYMLDEDEFLSPHGIRSLSRHHEHHPFVLAVNGVDHRVDYEPAESTIGLFGGNSNWRGPVWFPVNYLLVESLQKYHHFFGDDLKVACPSRSDRLVDLWQVSTDISRRLSRIFLPGPDGRRPVFGGTEMFHRDPHWRELLLFYEYFHGDNGAGLGASHQTGWTGIVAKLLQQSGEKP
jgi:mannosylglycerate hydrolase MGH1-like protein